MDPLLGGDAAFASSGYLSRPRNARILDGVFNHCGRGFWPFHHVVEAGAGSPYRHWFHLDQAGLDGGRNSARTPPEGEVAAMQAAADHEGRCTQGRRRSATWVPGLVGPARTAEAQHWKSRTCAAT